MCSTSKSRIGTFRFGSTENYFLNFIVTFGLKLEFFLFMISRNSEQVTEKHHSSHFSSSHMIKAFISLRMKPF